MIKQIHLPILQYCSELNKVLDPDWIRDQAGSVGSDWAPDSIRSEDPDLDQGGQKCPTKVENN